MTDRLPNFPAYTGVRPAPSPVRREEPNWEEYTGVRKARGAFGDPRYIEAGKPSERNFGEGSGNGSARAAAFGAWLESAHGFAQEHQQVPLPTFAIGDRVTHSQPGSFDITVTVDRVYDSGAFTGLDDDGMRWTIATKELAGCRKEPKPPGSPVFVVGRSPFHFPDNIEHKSPEELRALGFNWARGVAPIMGGDFTADSAFIRELLFGG